MLSVGVFLGLQEPLSPTPHASGELFMRKLREAQHCRKDPGRA